MKKYFSFLLCTVMASMLVVSCSQEDASQGPSVDEEVWYEAKGEETLTGEELANAISRTCSIRSVSPAAQRSELEDMIAQALNNHNSKEETLANEAGVNGTSLFYKSTIINYRSTDVNGDPILLSGRIYWGHFLKDLDPELIVIANHYTMTELTAAPSQSIHLEGFLAQQNALVVMPDLIGYGASAGQTNPYLCADVTALNTMDMVKAAITYIEEKGMTLQEGFRTYNIGYSQGATSALAVHRFIESDSKLMAALNFKGTYCGGGIYDPAATFKFITAESQRDQEVAMPALIALAFDGMKVGFPEIMNDINDEDFFTAEFLNTGVLTYIREKKLTIDQITMVVVKAMQNVTIGNILTPAALTPGNKVNFTMVKALECNNLLTGWTPQSQIYLFHSLKDNVAPFLNFENAVAAFPSNKVVTVVDNGDSDTSGMRYYSQIMSFNFIAE